MTRANKISAKESLPTLLAHLSGLQAIYDRAIAYPDSFYPLSADDTRAGNWRILQEQLESARIWVSAKQDATNKNNFAAHNERRALACYPHAELSALRAVIITAIDAARIEAKQMATNQDLLTDSTSPTMASILAENIIRAVTDSLERMNQHAERCATYNHEKERNHD